MFIILMTFIDLCALHDVLVDIYNFVAEFE